jgi:hypothetical protein
MKSVWSPDDLQEYLAGAANAYKIDRDWQEVLGMLTKGGGADGTDQPETLVVMGDRWAAGGSNRLTNSWRVVLHINDAMCAGASEWRMIAPR